MIKRAQSRIQFLLLGVALIGAASNSAHAEAASSNSPGATSLDEVVVTARRREERLQDVPISITAVSQEQLKAANVTSVTDLSRVVPGVYIAPLSGHANIVGFTIRGQRESTGFVTVDPSVGYYFADAVQARPNGVSSSLYDLQSVQVLQGPQGTLFGRNATGGAVLITPQPPVFGVHEGYGQLSYGSYDARAVEGAVNLPVSDSLAVRLGGRFSRRDGFVKVVSGPHAGERLNADHSDALRASIAFKPNDFFKNTLVVDYFKADAAGAGNYLGLINPASSNYQLLLPLSIAQKTRSNFKVSSDVATRSASKNKGFTNTTEINIDSVTVKNIGSFRRVFNYDIVDVDGSAAPIVSSPDIVKARQFTEELQLLGKAFDGRLDYILGAYYFRERASQVNQSIVFNVPATPLIADALNRSVAVFGQAEIHLTDKLTATGGVRYTWDKRQNTQTVVPLGSTCAGQAPQHGPGDTFFCVTSSTQFSQPTWTTSLSYKPTTDLMLYVTARSGYRSGAFNAQANRFSAAVMPVRPEKVLDFEAGIKNEGTIGDAPYRFNVSAFLSKYKDIQRPQQVLVPGGLSIRFLRNAARATIKGGETAFTVRPITGLELNASGAYTNAKYDRYVDATTGQDISFMVLANVPKFRFQLGASYELPMVSFAETSVSVRYSHTSSVRVQEPPAPYTEYPGIVLPAYGVWDARVNFDDVAGKGIRVSLYGRNLANKAYSISEIPLYPSLGFNAPFQGDPRTFGIEVGYKW